MPVPARIEWAIQLLDLKPDDRVLEFGCGPGAAAALVAERLTSGQLTAIDRSATAIARAAARNAGHLASGRLVLEQVSLADFRTEQPFHKSFGVNVNVSGRPAARPSAGPCATSSSQAGPCTWSTTDRTAVVPTWWSGSWPTWPGTASTPSSARAPNRNW
jgi:hypothetical protein